MDAIEPYAAADDGAGSVLYDPWPASTPSTDISDVEKRYGGIDRTGMVTYPNMGVDDRNQCDVESMPAA